jgi:membrane protease YdiL (CAAX protease family)
MSSPPATILEGPPSRSALKGLAAFLLLCFSLTWGVELGIYLTGGLKSSSLIFIVLVMFLPGLSALVAIRFVDKGRPGAYGISRGRAPFYVLAWLYPFAFLALGVLFVLLSGNPVDITLRGIADGLPQEGMLPLIVLSLLLDPVLNFLPTLGEEYGWRGFLQAKLLGRFGLLWGLVLTGAIWGVWHAPLILMGYNYPHHADALGVGMFALWALLVGFFLSWLRLRSGSVFPSALGHGAINAYAGLGVFLAPSADELYGLPLGLPALLALAILAVLAYLDLRCRPVC